MAGTNQEGSSDTKLAINNQRSPYYLSNADGPGVLLTNVLLRGETNYDAWAKAMKNALKAKNKLGFIDGTVKQPPETDVDETFAWTQCNSMLNSWIHNTIDPQLQPVMQYFENAKELWEDLKERYSVANIPRIYHLRTSLAMMRQQGMNVSSYYTKMRAIWDEIDASNTWPSCDCGTKCALIKHLIDESEKEKVYQFLMGLDDLAFGILRTQMLNYLILPNVNQVYALVTQEETRNDITRSRDTRGDVLSCAARAEPQHETETQGQKLAPEQTSARIPCRHCGKTNC